MIGKDPTLTGRTDIWGYVIPYIYQRPLLGWGYVAFWSTTNPAAMVIAEELHWFAPQAHNGLLEMLFTCRARWHGFFHFSVGENSLVVAAMHAYSGKGAGDIILVLLRRDHSGRDQRDRADGAVRSFHERLFHHRAFLRTGGASRTSAAVSGSELGCFSRRSGPDVRDDSQPGCRKESGVGSISVVATGRQVAYWRFTCRCADRILSLGIFNPLRVAAKTQGVHSVRRYFRDSGGYCKEKS